ncbi:MAG: permease-like cell division protein FtsX [Patescibacteria group bacterium]
MITTLSRIIHFGLQNFWRNGLLSTGTVAITLLALMVSLGLILFGVVTDAAVASVQDKIDISVYFKTSTSEDQVLSIKQVLEALPEVKNVDYVSRDQALEIFKTEHEGDEEVLQAISILGSNPLEAYLNIRAYKPNQYALIDENLKNPSIAQYVSSRSYSENQLVIDRLSRIISNVSLGGFALTIILALVAGLIVYNTIRLAIYSGRDEIGIMRAVGASNFLVRGPFMVDGILTGTIAAVLSLIIAAPVLSFLSSKLGGFVPGLDIFQYFYTNIFSLLGLQLLFGVGVCTISSFLAARRYLKN